MSLRGFWARTRSIFRTLRRGFPLNPSGIAVLALAGLAGWFYGVGRLDLILLTAAFCAAVMTLGLALSTLAAVWLVRRALHRHAAQEANTVRAVCGAWSDTGLKLRAPATLPFLGVDVVWETPPETTVALRGSRGEEMVYPTRRGIYTEIVRRVTVGDILGLTAVTWTHRTLCSVVMEPGRSQLERPADLLGLVAGEDLSDPYGSPTGDRVEVRRYGPGDSPRLILWKVYARTRRLFVRTSERALEAAPRTCAYLVADPQDEAAATLARTVLERGLLGDRWRFGADGAEDAEALPAAIHGLTRSGTLPSAPPELGPFLARAAKEGFGACLLLLPPGPGPWLAEVSAAVAGTPVRIHAVASFHGWGGEIASRRWWQRLLYLPQEPSGATAASLGELSDALLGAVSRFSLVDTETGAVLKDPAAFLAKSKIKAKADGGRAA